MRYEVHDIYESRKRLRGPLPAAAWAYLIYDNHREDYVAGAITESIAVEIARSLEAWDEKPRFTVVRGDHPIWEVRDRGGRAVATAFTNEDAHRIRKAFSEERP